ncbi:hypothetical protein Athai_02280 [Actinocatenispora thailandica]|uniref:Protein kinase domain-containing protein n=1 Tax=Actinocatenispora thailandica TaxID=227318 RepID=A0A7R7DJ89_9ACTN|nr:hypothetical protein [Actinocatenispora thailandica]BCJ32725.1 hypothetical protein Athai_02280 [Actinocatenispora thailandica]
MPRLLKVDLVVLLGKLPDDRLSLPGWGSASVATWRALLRSVPTDRRAFESRYEKDWDDTIARLAAHCRQPHPLRHDKLYGRLSVLLLTMLALDHSQRYRSYRGGRPDAPGGGATGLGHDCELLCRPLLAQPPVRAALLELYEPANDPAAAREWAAIDPATLGFHRHGTTSFIVSGARRAVSQGARRRFALKCLILPYLEIPTIERATRGYLASYQRDEEGLRHLARLWASSDSWVLMDFVPGRTLAERLADEPAPRPGDPLRLDLLERYGAALFEALRELDRVGLTHQDLSPSNIIVAESEADAGTGRVTMTLLDLGANYLYAQALPGDAAPDLPFVAPEVRRDGSGSRADLYSLGQLLVLLGTGAPADRGIVPDDFYAETPLMARFLEDLLDADPARRLLLFRPEPDSSLYGQLGRWFAEELTALRAAYTERVRPARADVRDNLLGLFHPFSGAPRRQRRLLAVRRAQRSYAEHRKNMRLRWLLGWSLLSATLSYLGGLLVLTYLLRELGLDFGGPALSVAQRVTGTGPDGIPFLDRLRAADYPVPDPRHNLLILAVGFTFVLVCAKYYQGLFAGLTPLVTGRHAGRLSVLAVVAEVAMRATVVASPVAIALPVVVERRWWLICVASGMTLVLFCNAAISGYARAVLRRARAAELSTVPVTVPGVQRYTSWLAGNVLYAFVLWLLAPLLYYGVLQDTPVYLVAVIIANVPQMYLIKCGIEAVGIRVGLGRACLAAERLATIPVPEPAPRPADHPVSPGMSVPTDAVAAN